MREIKFRAWDKIAKKMFYPKGFQYFIIYEDGSWSLENSSGNGDDIITCDTSDGEFSSLYDGVLMQYTGLKDKNGTDIYEGDIIKGKFGLGIGEVHLVVFWHKETASFKLRSSGDVTFNISTLDKLDNIIGNIYENPGLLNEPA